MRRRSDQQPVSDINITPLTDVMLVLLIIFMISSPVLLAKGLEVHLPQVEIAQQLMQQDHVLYVTADGALQLDGKQYNDDELLQAFTDMVSTADETGDVINLFLRADKSVTYDRLTQVMDLATSAGIEKISLVQDILEGTVVSSETDSSGIIPTEPDAAGVDSTGTGPVGDIPE
ncbi:MAG: biopolymer transporter ExbD [bacterium]|nr:biopolymer transporter ExbD [bacterium]